MDGSRSAMRTGGGRGRFAVSNGWHRGLKMIGDDEREGKEEHEKTRVTAFFCGESSVINPEAV